MRRRSLLLGLVAMAGVAIGSLGSAHAAAILVTSDSGSIGPFELINKGGGSFTLNFAPGFGALETLNGQIGFADAFFTSSFDFTVSPGQGPGGILVSSPIDLVKRFDGFGDVINNPFAEATFTLTSGEVGDVDAPNNLGFHGAITGWPEPLVDFGGQTYDFSLINTINLALTGTTYHGGATTMAEVFSIDGASVMGNAGFSQAAVPEPASMALLGIGLSGLIAFRRRFARRTTTA